MLNSFDLWSQGSVPNLILHPSSIEMVSWTWTAFYANDTYWAQDYVKSLILLITSWYSHVLFDTQGLNYFTISIILSHFNQ